MFGIPGLLGFLAGALLAGLFLWCRSLSARLDRLQADVRRRVA